MSYEYILSLMYIVQKLNFNFSFKEEKFKVDFQKVTKRVYALIKIHVLENLSYYE